MVNAVDPVDNHLFTIVVIQVDEHCKWKNNRQIFDKSPRQQILHHVLVEKLRDDIIL